VQYTNIIKILHLVEITKSGFDTFYDRINND